MTALRCQKSMADVTGSRPAAWSWSVWSGGGRQEGSPGGLGSCFELWLWLGEVEDVRWLLAPLVERVARDGLEDLAGRGFEGFL